MVPGKEDQDKRLDLLEQLVTQQETKLNQLQTTLGDILRVLEAISGSVGKIVCPETQTSDDSSSEDAGLGDSTQTLVRHKASEIRNEQHQISENEQQAKRKGEEESKTKE